MNTKKLISLVLAAVFTLICAFPVYAANAVPATEEWASRWSEISADEGKISLTPGTDESCVNFAWVTANSAEEFKYGTLADLSDASQVEVYSVKPASIMYYAHRVSLTDLDAGTYYYSYTSAGEWQDAKPFNIYDADGGFSALFCTDPQLGRSGDDSDKAVLDDTYGWDRTLNAALATEPDIGFALVAGDQVNMALSKTQYNALLYPQAVKSLPLATAVGNHDFYSEFYAMHFNNPNAMESDVLSLGGKGYYFSYGNALFIVLNSNNYLLDDHRATLNEAVNAYPDADWRVILMHNSLYCSGSGEYGLSAEVFSPLIDEYNVDILLGGHYHMYSRSYPITGSARDENGTVYFTQSSASGSNFYHPEASEIPEQIEYWTDISEPVYSIMDFDGGELNIKSYKTDSGEMFDEFTLSKDITADYEIPEYVISPVYAHLVEKLQWLIELIQMYVPFDFELLA